MKSVVASLFGSVVFGLLAIFLMELQASPAVAAETVMSMEESAQVVALRNVAVKDGAVSGEVVNNSSNVVRDVQLQIRSVWYWDNEFRPGENPPGSADYVTVSSPIPPGGNVRFTHPLSTQSVPEGGGHFETEVSVAGFTQVEQQNEQARKRNGAGPIL